MQPQTEVARVPRHHLSIADQPGRYPVNCLFPYGCSRRKVKVNACRKLEAPLYRCIDPRHQSNRFHNSANQSHRKLR
jgi:hypothetical protein